MKRIAVLVLCSGIVLGAGIRQLPAQGMDIHGADSTFRAEGLVLMWAVLKGNDEASTMVVLDLVKAAPAADRFRFYTVLAVDPFTGETRPELEAEPLQARNRVLRARPDFQLFSARRILFFADAESAAAVRPELTVYYQGVPDTSPEFGQLQDLEAYFSGVLERLGG
jgi:hypothetical protein